MAKNQFNPDYGDDPEVLKGALVEASEAIGHLQAELKEYKDSVGSASSVKLVDGRIKEMEKLKAKLVTAWRNWAKLLDLLNTALSDINQLQAENKKLKEGE